MLGATPVAMPLVESRGFSFDLNLLRDKPSERTRMLVLNSPQNPTGGVIPEEDMRARADMARDLDLIVLAEKTYSRIYTKTRPLRSPPIRACWRRPLFWTASRRPTR
jgi:aspartate/methionine/tyrosine aminotransferase